MTTLQLLQRMTRILTHKDVRTMPPEHLQHMLDAANLGLGEYVSMLPHIRRSKPVVMTLPAPVEKTITATASSATIAFSPAFAGQTAFYGCSALSVSDAGHYNRLAGLNTLLAPHNGATGSTTLTLYGDALQFDQTADAIDGKVHLQDGVRSTELLPERPQYWRSWTPDTLEVGTPRRWWVEPLAGLEDLNAPLFLMRVWPAPSAAMDLVFKLRMFPVGLTFDDVQTPRQLPVPVLEEVHLLNLCLPGLLTSTILSDGVNVKQVESAATISRGLMAGTMQRHGSTRRGRIFTPKNF